MKFFNNDLVRGILFAIGVALVYIVYQNIRSLFTFEIANSNNIRLNYSDVFNLILIVLTFIIIALTILGVVIASAALVGFQTLKSMAKQAVYDAVKFRMKNLGQVSGNAPDDEEDDGRNTS